MMTMAGGCLCGKLRYELDGEPTLIGKCYCTDCRKESGTGHMTFISFPADAMTISGEVRTFTCKGDSGNAVIRSFCPSCGTTIAGHPTILGDVKAVRAGTLDDPSGLVATVAVYGSRAPAWDQPPAGIMVFPELPEPG
jgi:hypothetical protein